MEVKETPSNLEAERNLIGLALVEKRIPSGARDLAITDFFATQWRFAWGAFLELEADGREIEPFGAIEIIKRDCEWLTLSELANTTYGMLSVNETVFVKKIRAASEKRIAIRKLSSAIEKISSGEMELSELKKEFADIETQTHGKGNFRSFAEILEKDVAPALERLKFGDTDKISTGFSVIDEAIGGGISLSDIILIAALPGAGKSALVLQIAMNIARQKIPVAYCSGEMTDKENAFRLISQAAKIINLNSATHIPQNEYDYLQQWLVHDGFKNLPIYFNSATSDLQTLNRELRGLIEETGIKVLVIDYVQLFKSAKNSRTSRAERIAEVSQEIKRIAMEYRIAVLEVAQFNREGAKANKTSMFDLEGSGQLEKDASLIFIIDREEGTSKIELRIVKGRNSAKTVIEGTFTGIHLTSEFFSKNKAQSLTTDGFKTR